MHSIRVIPFAEIGPPLAESGPKSPWMQNPSRMHDPILCHQLALERVGDISSITHRIRRSETH